MDATPPAHVISIVNALIVAGLFNDMERGSFEFAITGILVYAVSFIILYLFLRPYEKKEKELTNALEHLRKKSYSETQMLYHQLYQLRDFACKQSKINGAIADFTELSNSLEYEQKEFELKYSPDNQKNI